MVKAIRDKKTGQFTGSIGSGKSKVPTSQIPKPHPSARIGDAARELLANGFDVQDEDNLPPRQNAEETHKSVPAAERANLTVAQMDAAFRVMKSLGEPSNDMYGFRRSLIRTESYRGGNHFEWTNRERGVRFTASLGAAGRIRDAEVHDHGFTRLDAKAFDKANIELAAIFGEYAGL